MLKVLYSENYNPPNNKSLDKNIPVALLTCIDYRYPSEIDKFMKSKSYKYDIFSLAGASLGVTQTKYPHWTQSFFDYLDFAILLHQVNKVVVIDHMDCGAYKYFTKNPELEEHYKTISTIPGMMYKLNSFFNPLYLLVNLLNLS